MKTPEFIRQFVNALDHLKPLSFLTNTEVSHLAKPSRGKGRVVRSKALAHLENAVARKLASRERRSIHRRSNMRAH